MNINIESKSWAEPDIAWLHRFDYLTLDACHIQGQGVALGACYCKAYQAVCPRTWKRAVMNLKWLAYKLHIFESILRVKIVCCRSFTCWNQGDDLHSWMKINAGPCTFLWEAVREGQTNGVAPQFDRCALLWVYLNLINTFGQLRNIWTASKTFQVFRLEKSSSTSCFGLASLRFACKDLWEGKRLLRLGFEQDDPDAALEPRWFLKAWDSCKFANPKNLSLPSHCAMLSRHDRVEMKSNCNLLRFHFGQSLLEDGDRDGVWPPFSLQPESVCIWSSSCVLSPRQRSSWRPAPRAIHERAFRQGGGHSAVPYMGHVLRRDFDSVAKSQGCWDVQRRPVPVSQGSPSAMFSQARQLKHTTTISQRFASAFHITKLT